MFIFLMHVFTLNCNARIHITLRRCFSQSNAQKNKKNEPSTAVERPLLWQGQQDSNSRPTVLETVALPTKLYP